MARPLGLIPAVGARLGSCLEQELPFGAAAGRTAQRKRGRAGVIANRLNQAYVAARVHSLWLPLERIQQQLGGPGEPPVEAGLRDYILLITILVAFLEAAALQQHPHPPAVVMGFEGIHSPRSDSDDHS